MAPLNQPIDYTAGSAYHAARRKYAAQSQKCLQLAFDLLGVPSSLLDVGCGQDAPQVAYARERGVHAMGVDLAVPEGQAHLVRADLRERLDLGRQFQWVLSWETAEHISEVSADRFVHTIVRHMEPSGRILFTAAQPGQRGPGHVNCRPVDYWMQKFGECGVAYAADPTEQLARAWRTAVPAAPWYWRNLLVFWRAA